MLHPQARALLDLMIERGVPPTHTLTPAEARNFYRERRFFTQPDPPEVAEVRDLKAEGPHGAIPLRLYRPLGAAAGSVLPVLVYYHGGGWVIGDLDTHDTLCRELANGSGCARGRGRLPHGAGASLPGRGRRRAGRHPLGARAGRVARPRRRRGWRSAATAPAATWRPWWRSRRATPATCRSRSSC